MAGLIGGGALEAFCLGLAKSGDKMPVFTEVNLLDSRQQQMITAARARAKFSTMLKQTDNEQKLTIAMHCKF
jgi:hypothetical protein